MTVATSATLEGGESVFDQQPQRPPNEDREDDSSSYREAAALLHLMPPLRQKPATSKPFRALSPPTAFADLKNEADVKSKTLPRNLAILPPPPQYKGVHFADDCAGPPAIPTEGLPTGPAKKASTTAALIPTASTTVPIRVQRPSIVMEKKLTTSSSMTFGASKKT